MVTTIVALIIVLVIEITYKPRLDKLRTGETVLWYGDINNRKWVKLF